MSTHKDEVKALFPDALFLDEKPSSDLVEPGRQVEKAYTTLVGALGLSANPKIATLARTLWQVIHYRHVHTAMLDGIPTVTFMIAAPKGKTKGHGMILFPPGWMSLFEKDPLHATGSVVFTGSQALDFYNGRIPGEAIETTRARALSYEAEFMKAVPRDQLNSYQRDLLKAFPKGLDPKYVYEYRPVATCVS